MKKSLFDSIYAISALLFVGILSACSSDMEAPETQSGTDGWQKIKMTLNVSKPSFEEDATRAAVGDWKDKDRLFLTFFLDSGTKIPGLAFYEESTNSWDVEAYGALDTDSKSRKVQVLYFDTLATYSITGSGSLTVSMSPQTGIYRDTTATYTNKDGNIVVNASLTPATGRVRFHSDKGTSLRVSGPTMYSTYDAKSGAFTSTAQYWSSVTDSTEYTPYLYATYVGVSSPSLTISSKTPSGQSGRYTTTPNTSTFLATGKSGWMNVPTVERHKNWIYSVENVSYGSWSAYSTDNITIAIKDIEEGDTLAFTYKVYNSYNYSSNKLYYSLYASTSSQPSNTLLCSSSSNTYSYLFTRTFTSYDVQQSDTWYLYLYYYRYSTSSSYVGTAYVTNIELRKKQ